VPEINAILGDYYGNCSNILGIVVFHQNFQMFRLQQTKHDGETEKTCIKEKGVVFTVLIVVKRF